MTKSRQKSKKGFAGKRGRTLFIICMSMTDHPHIFDLIRYITGSEFESVYAEVAPNMRDSAYR